MTNIDQEIREALMDKNNEALQELAEEPGMFRQLGDTFRGRNRWLTVWGFVLTLIFMGIGVWALLQFLGAEGVRELVGFATLFVVAYLSVMALKIWFWMQMNRNTLTREVLRLELRIEEIQQQLKKK